MREPDSTPTIAPHSREAPLVTRPRPEIAPPPEWQFPTPQRARLSNGIDVLVFDLPGQHVIAAHLIFDCPLSAEDRDLEGVATICARTLDEGTRTHGGEEFAELLETEGAGFGIDVSLSGLQAVLDVPASRLESAFPLFAEAVQEPALSADDVNRHVQLRLAEIEQAQANSAQTAAIAFRRAVFADDRRAARMSGGEPETVAAVTPEAVQTFHADHFGPTGTTLVLAGEFASDPLGPGRALSRRLDERESGVRAARGGPSCAAGRRYSSIAPAPFRLTSGWAHSPQIARIPAGRI